MMFPFEPGSSPWTGPALTEERVLRAEADLGVKLPQSYLDLMRQSNGGVLKNGCFPTSFRTSWAEDHFQVDVVLGICYERGADAQSAHLVREWDYPD